METTASGRTSDCTCAHHASDLGHAPDSKAFEVVSECPNCHARDLLQLCSGRVLAMLGSLEADHDWVDCPVCGTSGPAKAFWQAVGAPTGADAAATRCRPGSRCVGC